MRKETTHLIVHCSATPEDMDIGVKEIDRWHRQKGWMGCGYHYVIRRDGTVETGRHKDSSGAHTKGYNHKSVGICLVGGVDADDKDKAEDNYTVEQKENLFNLLEELKKDYPTAQIAGHNQFAPKACPCFDVPEWLDDMKDQTGVNLTVTSVVEPGIPTAHQPKDKPKKENRKKKKPKPPSNPDPLWFH